MKELLTQIKNALVDDLINSEGLITQSDFYLTDVETDEKIQLCMPPEKISVKTDANFRSWNVINIGEIKLPRGNKLAEISWTGIIPSQLMLVEPFINLGEWESPQEVIRLFERWREYGRKLRLLITQTPINLEVFIKSFDYKTLSYGHYEYNLDLIAAKPLQIMTVAEADAARTNQQDNYQIALERRAAAKTRTGIRIQKINDIYIAALVLTGNGSWQSIQKILDRNGTSADELEVIIDGRKVKTLVLH